MSGQIDNRLKTLLGRVPPGSAHRNACGYPVERGARYDTIQLAVPRCSACRGRRIFGGFCAFALFLVVSAIAVLWQRYAYWILVLIFVVLVAIAVFVPIHEEGPRYRDIQDYPPLRRLRRAGWEGRWRPEGQITVAIG